MKTRFLLRARPEINGYYLWLQCDNSYSDSVATIMECEILIPHGVVASGLAKSIVSQSAEPRTSNNHLIHLRLPFTANPEKLMNTLFEARGTFVWNRRPAEDFSDSAELHDLLSREKNEEERL